MKFLNKFIHAMDRSVMKLGFKLSRLEGEANPEFWSRFKQNTAKHCKFVDYKTLDYSINISLKHKYLFTETPKAACSSIKVILQKIELDETDTSLLSCNYNGGSISQRIFSPLLKPSQIGRLDKIISNYNYFKFCFSRNPYTRLLSAYLEKIEQNKPSKRSILTGLGKNPFKLDQPVSFKEFINVVSRQSVSDMDPHWRIQYYQTFQDSITYDFIGKFETYDEDLNYALSKITTDYQRFISRETGHATNANNLISEYYSPDIIKLVQTTYAIDFEHFGYPTDLEITS